MTSPRGAALRARREAVVELWRQGRSTAVIAATLGITVATVLKDLQCARKANPDAVPRRHRRPLTAVQRAEIRVLKAEGRSPAAIARALSVDWMSVYRALRKAAMAEAAGDPRPVVGAIGAQIVAMWEGGHTGRAIADRFGLARIDDVYKVISRMAPELRPRRQRERRARGQRMLQQVVALRQQKRSYREIAFELGITCGMVHHYVLRGQASGAIARRQRLKPKIFALWEAGWKADAIADACGAQPIACGLSPARRL
jgi:transposase-like protein